MVTTLFGESQNYRPLSRSRTTLLGSLSLWEGTDHFVQIEVLAFSETHKRFYFEDVKAFTLCRTRRGLWLHLLWGVFTVATAAIALWTFASGYSSGGALDWLAVLVPSCFALAWLTHLALGPTCACHVMTPVQNARLGALARTRRARKVLAYLARRAQTSQGSVVTVETAASLEAGAAGMAGVSFKGPGQPDSLEREPGQDEGLHEVSNRLYPVVSAVSLLNAALLSSLLIWDSYPLRAIQVLFIVGLLALGITCAASSRRSRRKVAGWFKWIGWALFSVNGVIFVLWYGYGIYLAGAARRPTPGLDLNYVQQMLRISPHGSRFWFWVVLVDACFSMLVGSVALVILFRRTAQNTSGGAN